MVNKYNRVAPNPFDGHHQSIGGEGSRSEVSEARGLCENTATVIQDQSEDGEQRAPLQTIAKKAAKVVPHSFFGGIARLALAPFLGLLRASPFRKNGSSMDRLAAERTYRKVIEPLMEPLARTAEKRTMHANPSMRGQSDDAAQTISGESYAKKIEAKMKNADPAAVYVTNDGEHCGKVDGGGKIMSPFDPNMELFDANEQDVQGRVLAANLTAEIWDEIRQEAVQIGQDGTIATNYYDAFDRRMKTLLGKENSDEQYGLAVLQHDRDGKRHDFTSVRLATGDAIPILASDCTEQGVPKTAWFEKIMQAIVLSFPDDPARQLKAVKSYFAHSHPQACGINIDIQIAADRQRHSSDPEDKIAGSIMSGPFVQGAYRSDEIQINEDGTITEKGLYLFDGSDEGVAEKAMQSPVLKSIPDIEKRIKNSFLYSEVAIRSDGEAGQSTLESWKSAYACR